MNSKWEKHADANLIKAVKQIALEVKLPEKLGKTDSRDDLKALKEAGSELWLDTGDREAALKNWASELTGLTTNNTLANQVVQKGVCDKVIARAVESLRQTAPSLNESDLVVEIGFVVNTFIARSLISTFGVNVSVELHPAVADDPDATVMFAKRYHEIDPKHFYIKVPLTPAGIIAVRRISDMGIDVNFTLGFGARQNHLISRISKPAYLNTFLGRDNQVVVENDLGDGKFIGEKAALASQKTVTEARAQKISKTKHIAASFRSADQVLTLAGVDVHTIPPGVIEKYYAMNLKPSDIKPNLGADLKVNVKDDLVKVLWEIPDSFRKMIEALAKEDVAKMTPADLTDFVKEHGAPDLFGKYDDRDLAVIKAKGKIPDLSQWKGRGFALDDLLTVSALKSFTKDQEELDGRISGFLNRTTL